MTVAMFDVMTQYSPLPVPDTMVACCEVKELLGQFAVESLIVIGVPPVAGVNPSPPNLPRVLT